MIYWKTDCGESIGLGKWSAVHWIGRVVKNGALIWLEGGNMPISDDDFCGGGVRG